MMDGVRTGADFGPSGHHEGRIRSICQGDTYNGFSGQNQVNALPTFPFTGSDTDPTQVSGGNALLRWSRVLDDENRLATSELLRPGQRQDQTFADDRTTYDIDFPASLCADRSAAGHLGANYRNSGRRVQRCVCVSTASSQWNDAVGQLHLSKTKLR